MKLRWLLPLVAAVFIPLAIPQLASAAITHNSYHYPNVHDVGWANIRVGKIKAGSGFAKSNIGVDIWMQNPGLNGGALYAPCSQTIELNWPYYHNGCLFGGSVPSYYKNMESSADGSNGFPYGIFIDNANNGTTHNWGKKVTGGALEIYPHFYDPAGCAEYGQTVCWSGHPPTWGSDVIGAARVSVDGFNVLANGGAYSDANVGDISLPKYHEPGVVRLNGFGWKNGQLVGHDQLRIDVFGWSSDTSRSSTGYPISAFFSGHSKGDGYYNTGPLIGGTTKVFKIYFTDASNGNQVSCFFSIPNQYQRIDPNLSDPNYFGVGGWGCWKNF